MAYSPGRLVPWVDRDGPETVLAEHLRGACPPGNAVEASFPGPRSRSGIMVAALERRLQGPTARQAPTGMAASTASRRVGGCQAGRSQRPPPQNRWCQSWVETTQVSAT